MSHEDADSLITSLLEDAPDVKAAEGEYARNGVAFAARPDPGAIELRLGAEIADAAMRTPDTSSSGRGPDWIRFEPRDWDDHALDRLEAWFLVAWRLAEKRRGT